MQEILGVILLSPMLQAAPAVREQLEGDLMVRIRDEALFRSQIMRTVHFLTDVYGPRLTGSPNYKAASEWALQQMQSWGLENTHLEPWDFGHPGWANERLSAHAVPS